jgi:hypothetical protein
MQDSQMDYRSTIFSMITNIDEEDVKQRNNCEFESLVWHFLGVVHMNDFVRQELNGNLAVSCI